MSDNTQQIKKRLAYQLKKAYNHFWDHLIPHKGNNHHPHLLKHRALFGYSVFLILLKILVIVMPIALPSTVLYSSAISVQNIIDLTNRARINLNLPEVKQNNLLDQAAQKKAEDMVAQQYFAHTSPAGLTPWSFILNSGYKYSVAGENLAVHFVSAEDVQEGWMASPTHKANIVNSKFKEIGIGIAQGLFEGYNTTFVVQMFGAPQVLAATVDTDKTLVTDGTKNTNTSTVKTQDTVKVVEKPLATNTVITNTNSSIVGDIEKPAEQPVQEVKAAESTIVSIPPTIVATVNESSIRIVQKDNSYEMVIQVDKAKSVQVSLGSQTADLKNVGNNQWTGAIDFEPGVFSKNGELLSLTAISQDGSITRQPLAWLAPDVSTQTFYTFNDSPTKAVKLFGLLTIDNLDNSVTQFYFYFVLILSAVLLVNILIKIKIQHVSVISHTMLVLALALLLTVI